ECAPTRHVRRSHPRRPSTEAGEVDSASGSVFGPPSHYKSTMQIRCRLAAECGRRCPADRAYSTRLRSVRRRSPLVGLGACPSYPSWRGEGDAGRCEAAGWKKPETYSLEYGEDFFGPRTMQMSADRSPQ